MAKKKTLTVLGNEITVISAPNSADFISLTDLAKRFNGERPAELINNWMRNADTLEFLEVWETLNNPNFNLVHLHKVRDDIGKNRFLISPTKWIEITAAIGMAVKTGRYGGGTFAHRDIAMGFCFWLSPAFQLHVIQEFQRLKEAEAATQKHELEWNVNRLFSKINYRLHTDAVRKWLVPPRLVSTKMEGLFQASEADLLNLALFGSTAKNWREANPDQRGNLRDQASVEQLLVMANLENLNSVYLKMGLPADERLRLLNEEAIHQMELLVGMPAFRQLENAGQPLISAPDIPPAD